MERGMHKRVNEWICNIIDNHQIIMSLAMSQRAKFEGWLKFELAEYAISEGATDVVIEPRINEKFLSRADLAFTYNGNRIIIELKTPNTNYRMTGVENRTRPITKNIHSILEDIKKLGSHGVEGIIAFVLFPVRTVDNQWKIYLDRIKNMSENIRIENVCYSRKKVTISDNVCVEAIVVTIKT
jgi:hypothetical protein